MFQLFLFYTNDKLILLCLWQIKKAILWIIFELVYRYIFLFVHHQDVITDPKTAKSNRVIQMPAFLCEEMEDYIKSCLLYTSVIFAVYGNTVSGNSVCDSSDGATLRIRTAQLTLHGVKADKHIGKVSVSFGNRYFIERSAVIQQFDFGSAFVFYCEWKAFFSIIIGFIFL